MQCMGTNINSKKYFHPSRYENQKKYYEEAKKEEQQKLDDIVNRIKEEQNKLKNKKNPNNNFNRLGWMRYDLDDDTF